MKAAADQIRHENLGDEYAENNIANIDISADGTWQRRGYASLNGAVTVIGMDNGKCLAFQALTKVCKSCQAWKQHKGTDKYDEYLKTHDPLTIMVQQDQWKLLASFSVSKGLLQQISYVTLHILETEIRKRAQIL